MEFNNAFATVTNRNPTNCNVHEAVLTDLKVSSHLNLHQNGALRKVLTQQLSLPVYESEWSRTSDNLAQIDPNLRENGVNVKLRIMNLIQVIKGCQIINPI